MKATIKEFLKLESAGGFILIFAAMLAMLAANTPAYPYYQLLLDVPVEIRVGALTIAKPLILWINDGLMAIFFFLIGLEVKREFLQGELSKPSQTVLPFAGAVGGVLLPVAIYVAFNRGDPQAMSGWAIPAATDIAFALALLSILGNRVPVALKLFLVSVAIFDDIAAIVVIAVFYATELSTAALWSAVICLIALAVMNWRGVSNISPYIVAGVIMWVAILKSGVHATLAGIALAAFIPMKSSREPDRSPLRELENDLHPVVALFVLPAFAFVNAGVSLENVGLAYVLHPVPLGITLGLFLGKQFGVFVFCWITVKLGWSQLPAAVTWGRLYGACVLCGVGFTMSMFIGSLAFESEGTDLRLLFDERLGIIIGSMLAAITGYLVLHVTLPRNGNN